jgi:hypothetical protein
VNNPWSSPGPAKTSLRQQSSFERCPSHLPRSGDESAMNSTDFLSALRFSKPRAPRPGDMSKTSSGLRRPPDKRGRPRFTPSPPRPSSTTRPPWCTTNTLVPPSTRGDATEMMAPPAATTRAEAGVLTAGKTAAPHPGHRVHESSARPSAGLGSWLVFVSQPTSPSTPGRQTPSCGLPTTA